MFTRSHLRLLARAGFFLLALLRLTGVLPTTASSSQMWLIESALPVALQQVTPTPSPTSTNEAYPFVTPTIYNPYPDGATSTQPPSATPIPIQTATPFPGFFTPSPTIYTSQPGTNTTPGSGSATSTLLPFPTMTIEFPVVTTPAEVSGLSRSPGGSGLVKPTTSPGSGRRLWPIGLILLIWVLLGSWYYFTLRRFQP